MSYLKYMLVHDDKLVWARSGHGPVVYESLPQARKFQSHHTTPTVRTGLNTWERGPEVKARILEFTIVNGEPAVRWIE